MPTTKRFTPTTLARFLREGRGFGAYLDYVPWHGVSRSDPASSGRSHLHLWRGRQQALLSDGEWDCLLFTSLDPTVEDSTEQRLLSLESAIHDLSTYMMVDPRKKYLGTLELAALLGIKHPVIAGDADTKPWRFTTDRLIVYAPAGNCSRDLSALAVGAKPNKKLTPRERQLLALERAYWQIRGVPWIFFTRELYDPRVSDVLRSAAAWAFDKEAGDESIAIAQAIFRLHQASPLYINLQRMACKLGSMELAQRAFWQSVWHEALPIDMRMGWNLNFPYSLLSLSDFRELNPITMRRSSWS
ncbi:transposase [Variovorax ureilyticus]|uniref:Transposase n=1 Tax=Variovorax ureilyticus TaxID=1836198 RepID=A0ABU8VRB2_9BURK